MQEAKASGRWPVAASARTGDRRIVGKICFATATGQQNSCSIHIFFREQKLTSRRPRRLFGAG